MREGELHHALTYEIGRLYCGVVRDYLEEQRLIGRRIKWHEGTGVFERRFLIAGDPADLAAIGNELNAWVREIQEQNRGEAQEELRRQQRSWSYRLPRFVRGLLRKARGSLGY